jgi:hypothetical protein
MEYTLKDIIDAVQYGFDYREDAMNHGVSVPVGNTLQWLMNKKGLIEIPQEFKDIKDGKEIT